MTKDMADRDRPTWKVWIDRLYRMFVIGGLSLIWIGGQKSQAWTHGAETAMVNRDLVSTIQQVDVKQDEQLQALALRMDRVERVLESAAETALDNARSLATLVAFMEEQRRGDGR